jgi:hypothetical protein
MSNAGRVKQSDAVRQNSPRLRQVRLRGAGCLPERHTMRSLIYDSAGSIRQLLDSGFEMPIHFAAVGTNGAVVAGTYRAASHGRSFTCQITVETTCPEGLTAPVNVMYVDCRGVAALVVLRPSPSEPVPQ